MSDLERSYKLLLVDRRSGASEILRKTLIWVQACLKAGWQEKAIHDHLNFLRHEHPSLALLRNFHQFFQKISLNIPRVRAWARMYRKHEEQACRRFAEYLSYFRNVLVHSNSRLVYTSLKMVPSRMSIFCTESRPGLEGRRLAERLSRLPHHVILIPDFSAFSTISRVDALVFGCAAITPKGILNKIGTAPLAAAAVRDGKPVSVIATSEKISSVWDEDFLLFQGPNEEIYAGKSPLKVENYYFDVTPREHIRSLFLETGEMDYSTHEKALIS